MTMIPCVILLCNGFNNNKKKKEYKFLDGWSKPLKFYFILNTRCIVDWNIFLQIFQSGIKII